jgi:hypothetical protein
MSFESLLPKLFRCPECATELHEIVYGMLAGPPKANQVVGGCEWSDEAPTKVCPKCKWEGALGGRSWPIEFTRRTQIYDESAPNNVRNEQHDFNLRTMTDEELFELGKSTITARFELVHRGVEAAEIDDFYDQLGMEAISSPLIKKYAYFVFYNSETQQIDQACIYSAQRSMHEFLYLRHGMDEWQIVETLDEFHEVVFGMEKPSLVVWSLNLKESGLSRDDSDSQPFTYGSVAIKAMLAETEISQDELLEEGSYFAQPIYWPDWFDEGAMLSYVQYPWAQR